MTSILAAMVNAGFLSALVTAAVWLALRLTPRRALNAATRYAVWWAALAVAIALPALYLPRNVAGPATPREKRALTKAPASQAAPLVERSAPFVEAPAYGAPA